MRRYLPMKPSRRKLATHEHVVGDRERRRDGEVLVRPSRSRRAGLHRRAEADHLPSSRTSPSSGTMAPDTALTIVDLPAPLSPITARISPRCRSKSALLRGGHPAVALEGLRPVRILSAIRLPRNLSDPLVDHDSGDDENADQQVGPLRIGSEQAKAEAEDTDDERAEQHAEDRAATTEERDAADHHRRDTRYWRTGRVGETEPMRPIRTQPPGADEAGDRRSAPASC